MIPILLASGIRSPGAFTAYTSSTIIFQPDKQKACLFDEIYEAVFRLCNFYAYNDYFGNPLATVRIVNEEKYNSLERASKKYFGRLII